MAASVETSVTEAPPAIPPAQTASQKVKRSLFSHYRRLLLLVGAIVGLLFSLRVGATAQEGRPDLDDWNTLAPPEGSFIGGLLPQRAAALGLGPGGREDLFIGWVRLGESGTATSVFGTKNISRSPGASEANLAVAPERLAYCVTTGDGDAMDTVDILLLEDTDSTAREGWTTSQAFTAALSSLQHWGQLDPPRSLRLQLEQPSETIELSWSDGALRIATDQGLLVVDVERGELDTGAELASLHRPEAAQPDLFRWAVDQLRYSRLVGPDRLQQLEELYLEVSDAYAGITEHTSPPPSPEALTAHLGRVAMQSENPSWPPEALDPILEPALEGEGEWRERDERFLTPAEGAPPLFYTAFLRTDPERARSSRVFMTVWDPAWLELGWVAGTQEPRSTVGHRGDGRIPRDELPRLVAGFNGGFQAVDGAFGMRTEQGEFLPPVPYGATIARLADGRIGMGTWPQGDVEETTYPQYRQNLTALIEDGETNPYRRRFWGGVPSSLSDTSRTDRTGLCLTHNNQMIYFWGKRVTVEGLARAMESASCDFGMLLDINFSNTVFETYRVGEPESLPPLDRELNEQWEREGPVPGQDDLVYRVQAMAPGMTRVGFPRYIRTELRDFFFLTIRPQALGAPTPELCDLRPLDDSTFTPPRAWRCALDVNDAAENDSLELIELSPHRTQISVEESPSESRWLAWSVGEVADDAALALDLTPRSPAGTTAAIRPTSSARESEETTRLLGLPLTAPTESLAPVAGVVIASDENGQLVLVGTTWPVATTLRQHLTTAGFDDALFLPRGERWLVVAPAEAPMATRIFQDTDPVPPRVWGPIHRRAQQYIDELGLTRHYVQIRHYRDRDLESEAQRSEADDQR